MSNVNTSKVTLELGKTKFTSKALQVTEQSAKAVAAKLYNNIMEGNASALETAEFIAFVGKIGEEIKAVTDINGKNSFTSLVRDEIERDADDSKKYVSKLGTKIELFTSSGKGDYSVCGHPYYDYLTAQENEIKKKKKTLEAFLKTIQIPTPIGNVPNPETGEIYENVEVLPPNLPKTDTYKLTLLKD